MDGTDSADDMESSFFPDDGGIHDRDMQKEIDKEKEREVSLTMTPEEETILNWQKTALKYASTSDRINTLANDLKPVISTATQDILTLCTFSVTIQGETKTFCPDPVIVAGIIEMVGILFHRGLSTPETDITMEEIDALAPDERKDCSNPDCPACTLRRSIESGDIKVVNLSDMFRQPGDLPPDSNN